MGTTPYSIRFDDDLRKSLEKEAEIEGLPPAQLAVRAIRSMLHAKAAKRAAIDAALEEADQGKFISAEAINAWIDSWDSKEELRAPKGCPHWRRRMKILFLESAARQSKCST